MTQIPLRRSEEYPLLNPDGGGDVMKPVMNQPPTIPVEWNVTCAPKRPSWMSRWHQLLSGCWMSVVLLTILFVIFYAFGSIYRLQSVVMLKYNDSKPAGEVYYHYVVPRYNPVPFKSFTNYLSFMATKYPLLNFNVYLLLDDTPQSSFYHFPKKMRFKRFVPKYSGPLSYVLNRNNDRDIQEFQRKHPNINVSVLSLSKYTAKTPLQVKWRAIPLTYLPFYVRAYEIWKNGGIGLNLLTQNYRFNVLKRIDFKLDSILKQHSKNVDVYKYTQALDYIDNQEEREFFAIVLDAFNDIPRTIYQTFYNFGMLSDNFHDQPMTPNKIKRDISNNKIPENMSLNDANSNISDFKIEHKNKGNDSKAINITHIKNTSNKANVTVNKQHNDSIPKHNDNPSDPNFYHVVDIPRLIDVVEGLHDLFDVDVEYSPDMRIKNSHKNYLTLNSDGSIIAAYSRNHPFLFKLLYTPKNLRSDPRYVISDTIREICFRFMHDYCDSIKILNNL